ncbi:MAG: peptidoglycan-binding domain-containing protein [Hyphomicrobium sp.]|nr:peptidoglycan-binding domain-containing protein [Hyphomicrobium sp.]
MRALLGLWCLLSGVALGLYIQPTAPVDQEKQVAAVARIIAQSTLDPAVETPLPASEPSAPPGSTERLPALAGTSKKLIERVTDTRSATAEPKSPEIQTVAAVEPPRTDAWTPTVSRPSSDAVQPGETKAQAGGVPAERRLARDIQRELDRLGCYGGRIDGVWGGASQDAMMRFLRHVNASLPVTEPDLILLSLAKAHPSGICATECAPDETLASGRCVPRAVMAQAKQTGTTAVAKVATDAPAPRVAAVAPETAVRPAKMPLDGRMSVGGPVDPASEPVAREVLPWKPAPAAGATGATAAVPAVRAPRVVYAALPDDDGLDDGVEYAPRIEAKPVRVDPPKAQYKAKRAKAEAKARQRRASYSYGQRSVQSLFQHPLGRM